MTFPALSPDPMRLPSELLLRYARPIPRPQYHKEPASHELIEVADRDLLYEARLIVRTELIPERELITPI